MRGLLQYTLDLFESVAPVQAAQDAPQKIAVPAFSHPRGNRQVRLGHAMVEYHFQRARRRTIGFMVGPDGLLVRAPRWTPLYEVEAALQEKAVWIIRKLDETRERQARQDSTRIEWRDGAVLPFLGESAQLLLDGGHAFSAVGAQLDPPAPGRIGPQMLRVALPRSVTPEQIRDAVQAWLMSQARINFSQRLDHFAPLLQVQWRKLTLSSAGTRWGSARLDGSIRLNWRLIHFKQSVIDYVVAHELSHLRVMDHSAQFWDTVRTVVPDYADLRRQLKDDAIPKW